MRKSILSLLTLLFIGIGLFVWIFTSRQARVVDREWREYLGGPDRNHYSPLDQITPENVHLLEMAWQYHSGDTGQIQCNPIMVNGLLYGMTATTQPFALDAATGEEKWRNSASGHKSLSTSRGVVFWEEGQDQRILYTQGEWLYAVDALTGAPILSFGQDGRISLKSGLGKSATNKSVISNTPGTVYEDLIIMPMRLSEGPDAALGHIQAFNIRTGELAWVFHTLPQPGELGYDTWPEDAYQNIKVGGGNNWAGMAVDRERGIVFVPTGSAAPDFYGGDRKGANLFTNSLLALDAATGKRIWHYQLVHHDILDRDLPAPPNLVTVNHQGRKIDAVVQITKQGYVFVFNRETGEPLFPIEEKEVPSSDIPGEETWPTQPFPLKPAPYARQSLTAQDISPYAENREELVRMFSNYRSEGPFTPLSEVGSIVFPGLDGGAEWGGAAVDPEGILYLNSNEMAWNISLGAYVSEEVLKGMSPGKQLYTRNCVSCHGQELQGNPNSGFPSLQEIGSRKRREDVTNIIAHGQGMMPSFRKLTDQQMTDLMAFLFEEEAISSPTSHRQAASPETNDATSPYQISGYTKFLDSNGYPAIAPPWGTLNAIDLNTGEYLWKIPYGEYPELMEKGLPQTGAESYGGPVVTASGLLLIAGTKDEKFRIYDKKTGKLLWETQLPAASFATPSTYEMNGKQYIVLACGGTKLGAKGGDSYVAYALP